MGMSKKGKYWAQSFARPEVFLTFDDSKATYYEF